MKMKQVKNVRGFVLTELLLGVAVVAVLALIGAGVYQSLRSSINADDMADKTVAMVSDIQKAWRNAGNYSTVAPAEVNKLSLVRAPLRFDGTNLSDAYGNTMALNGTNSTFALTIGGSAAPIARDDCATIANKLASIAMSIRIGSDAAASAGATTGGLVFKTGATITQASLADGCSVAAPIIAAQFR